MRILRFVVGARREARATRLVSALLLTCLAWAAPAWATCGDTFTDDPLMPGQTVVKAVHVTELRTAINCLRTEFSLSTVTWTQTLTAGTTVVYDVDVEELRTALNAVYSAASMDAPAYTDTSLSGVAIKAIHLQELRTAVRIVEPAGVSEATWVLQYYHTDVIGSVRAITDASGDTVIRHDYAPFGEDTQALTGNPMRFAGKELDPESAWNYFDARYFRNIYGRFGTVDPVDGTLTDTQSWNTYAYARNNPFVFADPTGLSGECAKATTFCVEIHGELTDDFNWEKFWDEWFSRRSCHVLFIGCPGNNDNLPPDGSGESGTYGGSQGGAVGGPPFAPPSGPAPDVPATDVPARDNPGSKGPVTPAFVWLKHMGSCVGSEMAEFGLKGVANFLLPGSGLLVEAGFGISKVFQSDGKGPWDAFASGMKLSLVAVDTAGEAAERSAMRAAVHFAARTANAVSAFSGQASAVLTVVDIGICLAR